MTHEQWIAAAWIFGSVFTVLGVLFSLSLAFGGKKKPKPDRPIEAWEFHEGSHEGKYWRKTK